MAMRLILLLWFAGCSSGLLAQSAAEPDTSHVFKVDPSIKAVVLEHISFKENSQGFDARLTEEYFENDSLVYAVNDTGTRFFWGRYWWWDGVMRIMAAVGELRTSGFIADVTGPNAGEVKHNVCAHDHGEYCLQPADTPTICVEAPCSSYELVISRIPDSASDEPVYGYVQFKSTDYFHQEREGFSRRRANMRFYFRAINFDHYLRRRYPNYHTTDNKEQTNNDRSHKAGILFSSR